MLLKLILREKIVIETLDEPKTKYQLVLYDEADEYITTIDCSKEVFDSYQLGAYYLKG
jgi:hypothetical protein